MLDVMIDLETMGTGSRAAIVAIGAVKFDPHELTLLPHPLTADGALPPHMFYCLVDLESSMRFGLECDASTIEFWLAQDDAARGELLSLLPQKWAIGEALYQLRRWWELKPVPEHMWSHATFDAVILNEAYRLKREKPPWLYKNARDLRTLFHLVDMTAYQYDATMKHHALWDAWRQANMVKWAYSQRILT